MKTNKLQCLQAADWKVGSAEYFLELSVEEARLVVLKLADQRGKKSRAKNKPSPYPRAAHEI